MSNELHHSNMVPHVHGSPVALVTGAAEARWTEILTVRLFVKMNTQNISGRLPQLGRGATAPKKGCIIYFSWGKSG